MLGVCAKCQTLITDRRLCNLCSGNKFTTAKWPVTSALDLYDTSTCHGGHLFSSDSPARRVSAGDIRY